MGSAFDDGIDSVTSRAGSMPRMLCLRQAHNDRKSEACKAGRSGDVHAHTSGGASSSLYAVDVFSKRPPGCK
jgi:hypothetical protein